LIVQDVPVAELQPNPAEIRVVEHGNPPMPHIISGPEEIQGMDTT